MKDGSVVKKNCKVLIVQNTRFIYINELNMSEGKKLNFLITIISICVVIQ